MTPRFLAALSAISFFLLPSHGLAADLVYKKLTGHDYELVLSNDVSLTVEQAQAMMQDPAATLCGNRKPKFGRYVFQDTDAFSGQKSYGKAAPFNMLQMINCVGDVAETPMRPKAEPVSRLSDDDEVKLRIEARKLTAMYLTALENAHYETAYSMLGDGLKEEGNYAAWQARVSAYQAQVGKAMERDLWRVTVTERLPASALRGVHLTVEYESKYGEGLVTCGFVTWFLPAGSKSNFTIVREGYGNTPGDVPTNIPAAEQVKLRKMLGCKG